jgi:opacity protein-like surface antigen
MERKPLSKLSLLFLMAVTPVSIALAQSVTPCSFNGFTIGLGLGASTFMTQVNNAASLSSVIPADFTSGGPGVLIGIPPNTTNFSTNADIYRFGPMARLFIGYGNVFANYAYVGAELGLNGVDANDASMHSTSSRVDTTVADFGDAFLNLQTISNTFETRTKIERNTVEPTLDLKLGFLMTPTTLVYLRGGINYNEIKIKTHAAYSASAANTGFPISSGSTQSLPMEGTHKSRSVGLRAGLGAEYLITPTIGISADYVYSWYRNTTAKTSGLGTDVMCDILNACAVIPATQASTSKVQTDDQQILAQVIYHFG